MGFVADIETIKSQLAKPEPNRAIIQAAWETVKAAAAINGCDQHWLPKSTNLIGMCSFERLD